MTNTRFKVGQLATVKMQDFVFEAEVAYKEGDKYIGVLWTDMPEGCPFQFDDEIVFSDEDTIA